MRWEPHKALLMIDPLIKLLPGLGPDIIRQACSSTCRMEAQMRRHPESISAGQTYVRLRI